MKFFKIENELINLDLVAKISFFRGKDIRITLVTDFIMDFHFDDLTFEFYVRDLETICNVILDGVI